MTLEILLSIQTGYQLILFNHECRVLHCGQAKDGVNEIIQTVVGNLQADISAVKRRRPFHLSHLVKVPADQRDHL